MAMGVHTTLAEVLCRFGAPYLHTHTLSTAQARAWRAIVACRTAALGGQRLRCEGCAVEHWRWHLVATAIAATAIAAIATARSAKAASAMRGAPRGWANFSTCRIATWSSPCRTSSMHWRRGTRAGSTTR